MIKLSKSATRHRQFITDYRRLKDAANVELDKISYTSGNDFKVSKKLKEKIDNYNIEFQQYKKMFNDYEQSLQAEPATLEIDDITDLSDSEKIFREIYRLSELFEPLCFELSKEMKDFAAKKIEDIYRDQKKKLDAVKKVFPMQPLEVNKIKTFAFFRGQFGDAKIIEDRGQAYHNQANQCSLLRQYVIETIQFLRDR